jgi:hypothetical protein
MAIVAGSLIFRPNRCVRIGRSCSRRVARPPANCDRCTPAFAGCQLSPAFQEGPGVPGPSSFFKRLEVHAAHSAHTSTGTSRHRWALLLRQLGNHRLGRDEQAGDRGRTLQCRAHLCVPRTPSLRRASMASCSSSVSRSLSRASRSTWSSDVDRRLRDGGCFVSDN